MTAAVWVALGSAVIALASLSYTILDKRRSLSKKLSWIVTSNTDLMQGGPDRQWTDLEVSWKGQKLQHPRLVLLEIVNTGRVELEADKIHVEPVITLEDGKILSAELHYRPTGSETQKAVGLKLSEHSAEGPAFTLNPRDKLVFRFLVDGGRKPPALSMAASGFKITQGETTSPADNIAGELGLLTKITATVAAGSLTAAIFAIISDLVK